MEILFRQSKAEDQRRPSTLEAVGIERAYLKRFHPERDRTLITVNTHHHTCFEIHIVEEGYQIYTVEDKTVKINAGEFLLIPPFMKHRAIESAPDTFKYGLAFNVSENSEMHELISDMDNYTFGKTPNTVKENIDYMRTEKRYGKIFSSSLISNRMFESIVFFLRASGVKGVPDDSEEERDDIRLVLAKQYLSDNVLRDITVKELAAYCCVCPRQLSRIFKRDEGVTVAEYIRKERYLHIERMLATSSLSLREISEKMNFNNEYYFNSFFRKYSGMSPGNYRKWIAMNQ